MLFRSDLQSCLFASLIRDHTEDPIDQTRTERSGAQTKHPRSREQILGLEIAGQGEVKNVGVESKIMIFISEVSEKSLESKTTDV